MKQGQRLGMVLGKGINYKRANQDLQEIKLYYQAMEGMERAPGRGSSRCKGPGVRVCLGVLCGAL